MTRKRTALIAGGVAAGAIAAGAVGRTVLRRRTEHELEAPLWDLPPDDLGPVRSFDGTHLAVRAAGDPVIPAAPLRARIQPRHDHLAGAMGGPLRGPPVRADGPARPRGERAPRGRRSVGALDGPRHRRGARGRGARSAGRDRGPQHGRDRDARDGGGPPRPAGDLGRRARARRHVGVRARPWCDGLDHRSRAAATGFPAIGRRARRPPPQGGPREPHRPAGRGRPAHAVRTRRAPPRGGPRGAPRGTSLVGGVDRRPRRAARDRSPTRAPARRRAVAGRGGRARPGDASLRAVSSSPRRFPDGRFVLLDGAGHIAMLERPVELDREIRSFARGVLSSGHRGRAAARRFGSGAERDRARSPRSRPRPRRARGAGSRRVGPRSSSGWAPPTPT